MSQQQTRRSSPDSAFSASVPVESLQPLIESVLESTGCVPGWPIGRVALNEPEAAECIGVKRHVLRDARLKLKLAHTQVGRTVTYTTNQLSNALEEMAVNSRS